MYILVRIVLSCVVTCKLWVLIFLYRSTFMHFMEDIDLICFEVQLDYYVNKTDK